MSTCSMQLMTYGALPLKLTMFYRLVIAFKLNKISKIKSFAPIYSPLPPQALRATDLFFLSIVLCFPECLGMESHRMWPLQPGFLHRVIMHLWFLHVFPWLDGSFLFGVESSMVWMGPS